MLLFFQRVRERQTDMLRLRGTHLESINFSKHQCAVPALFLSEWQQAVRGLQGHPSGRICLQGFRGRVVPCHEEGMCKACEDTDASQWITHFQSRREKAELRPPPLSGRLSRDWGAINQNILPPHPSLTTHSPDNHIQGPSTRRRCPVWGADVFKPFLLLFPV